MTLARLVAIGIAGLMSAALPVPASAQAAPTPVKACLKNNTAKVVMIYTLIKPTTEDWNRGAGSGMMVPPGGENCVIDSWAQDRDLAFKAKPDPPMPNYVGGAGFSNYASGGSAPEATCLQLLTSQRQQLNFTFEVAMDGERAVCRRTS